VVAPFPAFTETSCGVFRPAYRANPRMAPVPSCFDSIMMRSLSPPRLAERPPHQSSLPAAPSTRIRDRGNPFAALPTDCPNESRPTSSSMAKIPRKTILARPPGHWAVPVSAMWSASGAANCGPTTPFFPDQPPRSERSPSGPGGQRCRPAAGLFRHADRPRRSEPTLGGLVDRRAGGTPIGPTVVESVSRVRETKSRKSPLENRLPVLCAVAAVPHDSRWIVGTSLFYLVLGPLCAPPPSHGPLGTGLQCLSDPVTTR